MARAKKTQVSGKAAEQVDSNATTISELPDKENRASNEQVTFSSRVEKAAFVIKKNPRTMSKKSGLVLPVLKVLKDLKKGNYADKIQKGEKMFKLKLKSRP